MVSLAENNSDETFNEGDIVEITIAPQLIFLRMPPALQLWAMTAGDIDFTKPIIGTVIDLPEEMAKELPLDPDKICLVINSIRGPDNSAFLFTLDKDCIRHVSPPDSVT